MNRGKYVKTKKIPVIIKFKTKNGKLIKVKGIKTVKETK
jgi:hypothetical protein